MPSNVNETVLDDVVESPSANVDETATVDNTAATNVDLNDFTEDKKAKIESEFKEMEKDPKEWLKNEIASMLRQWKTLPAKLKK